MPEIYTKSNTDRIWIKKLRNELGQEIFEHVVHRMLRGDSLRALGIYCHQVNPEYAAHTYRKWLAILEQHGTIAQKREADVTQKAITAFNSIQAKAQVAPEIIKEARTLVSRRWLDRIVTKEWDNVKAANELKLCWIAMQQILEKEMTFSEDRPLPYPSHKTVSEMRKIAVAQMNLELRMSALKVGTIPDIDVSQLDPIAQKFARLSDVDRNIIHNLQKRFVKLIAEDPNGQAALEGLEFDPNTTLGAEPRDNPPDDYEPDPAGSK